jgi:hypothetical protein
VIALASAVLPELAGQLADAAFVPRQQFGCPYILDHFAR